MLSWEDVEHTCDVKIGVRRKVVHEQPSSSSVVASQLISMQQQVGYMIEVLIVIDCYSPCAVYCNQIFYGLHREKTVAAPLQTSEGFRSEIPREQPLEKREKSQVGYVRFLAIGF